MIFAGAAAGKAIGKQILLLSGEIAAQTDVSVRAIAAVGDVRVLVLTPVIVTGKPSLSTIDATKSARNAEDVVVRAVQKAAQRVAKVLAVVAQTASNPSRHS